MVLYVMKYDIRPEKAEAYARWVQSALPRLLSVPGVVEFRAYRPATGAHQVVVTLEFADMAAWAAWRANEDVRNVTDERRAYITNVTSELWGPSQIVPDPIRPG